MGLHARPRQLRALCVASVPAPATQTLTLAGLGFFLARPPKAERRGRVGEAADVSARSKQTSATRPTRWNARGRAATEHREAAEVVLLKHRRSNRPKPGPKPRNLAKAGGKREGCAHSAAERTAQREHCSRGSRFAVAVFPRFAAAVLPQKRRLREPRGD